MTQNITMSALLLRNDHVRPLGLDDDRPRIAHATLQVALRSISYETVLSLQLPLYPYLGRYSAYLQQVVFWRL